MWESHIRDSRLQSPAAAVTTDPHQQRPAVISLQTCCAVRMLAFPPMTALAHAGKYYMCTFPSVWVQHSTQFSLHLTPLQALPKPAVDQQGTSMFPLSGWCHLPKLPWTKKSACVGSVTYKNMQTLSVQHKPFVLPSVCMSVCVCVCVCRGGPEFFFRQRSKVFQAAMWSHAKFFFSIWLIVQYRQ